MCVVVCGSFERDDKKKRHRRVAKIRSPLASTKKNSLGLHGFEHFFPFDWRGFFPLVVLCRVLSRYYYYYYYYYYYCLSVCVLLFSLL